MTALPPPRRRVEGVVLGPDDVVPEAVRMPRVVRVTQFDCDMTIEVELSDGGRWRLNYQELRDYRWRGRGGDLAAIPPLLVALWKRQRLRFVGRRRPRNSS